MTLAFVSICGRGRVVSFVFFHIGQLLCELEAERCRDISMGNANPANRLQLHIFIPRPERGYPTPPLRENVGLDDALAQYAQFTPDLLLEVCVTPGRGLAMKAAV